MTEAQMIYRENVAWVDRHHLIHTVFHGDQTPDKMRHTFGEIQTLCDEMAAEGNPLLLLWDIRDIHAFPVKSRLLALNARTYLPFWRLAIVGSDDENHVATSVSLSLTAMSGRKREINYFASLFDATKWLDETAREYNRQKSEWPVLPS